MFALGVFFLRVEEGKEILTVDVVAVPVIPKQHTIFETSIEGFTIRLFGNNFMARPTARGMKKIKAKKTIEL